MRFRFMAYGVCLVGAFGSVWAGNWSEWRGGPERNGVVSNPASLFTNPKGFALEEVWSQPMLGEGKGNYGSAVIEGQTVYAWTNVPKDPEKNKGISPAFDTVHALDLQTGKVRWTRVFDGRCDARGACNTPCVAAGRVYGVDSVGLVFCVDAADGTVKWQTDIKVGGKPGKYQSSVTVAGDRVVVATGDLACLDASTGAILWRQDAVQIHDAGSPAIWVHAGKTYALAGSTALYLVDLADGKVVWTLDVIPGNTTVAVSGDILVVNSNQDKNAKPRRPGALKAYRLTLEPPTELWSVPLNAANTSPSTDGKRVYLPGGAVIDLANGKEIAKGQRELADILSCTIIAGETLIGWNAPYRTDTVDGAPSTVAFFRATDGSLVSNCKVTRLGSGSFPALSGDLLVFRGLDQIYCYRIKAVAL